MVTFPRMVKWSSHTTITKEEAITMDCHDYITVAPERKRGQHLGQDIYSHENGIFPAIFQ